MTKLAEKQMVYVTVTGTATITEVWAIEVPEGQDVNETAWTGWEDALAQGQVTRKSVIQTDTKAVRNRKVEQVTR
jgi:cellulase/cellobiase CelA1